MADIKLKVRVSREINGIEMGVFDDGTSYLTARGLAQLCGVAPSTFITQAANWRAGNRSSRLAQWLLSHGITRENLHQEISPNGKNAHAYTDDIAMLVLEYYVFEAGRDDPAAKQRYRALARAGLRLFVYQALGYDPSNRVPNHWRHFHDRVTMVSAPAGYFSVFKETADFVISAIRGGLTVDDRTVPDISVGITWSKHWQDNELDKAHGQRVRHNHNYPEYFRQAESNPQQMWVYPIAALPAFRSWMNEVYVSEKLPTYLKSKVKKGELPASTAEVLVFEYQTSIPKLI